jgi:2-methylisocitrate lyase-like PEP mutase family enzyme
MSGDDLRALLRTDGVTHVPGVWDPATAALAVRAGHRAVHLSGTAVSAVLLGRSDLGFGQATQIADRADTLVPALQGVPLLADADIGYDSPMHAVWTALAYTRAGISGLVLADQTGTITALVTQVPQLAVIASTDVYAVSGLDDTIERCRRFAGAGADAVLPDGVDDIADLGRLHDALPGVPIVVNRSEAGGGRPGATDADLAEVGVRMVLHPMAALLAALRAASMVYRAIADTGTAEPVERLPWAAFTDLVEHNAAVDADARYVPGRLET